MPDIARLGAAAGFARGFAPAFSQSRRQRLEQEKKGRQDEIQNLEKTMKLLEKYYPDDPRLISIADTLIGMRGGVPPRERAMPPITMPAAQPFRGRLERARTEAPKFIERERKGIVSAKKEVKSTLRKRAEQLMKQRRDFLRGDPIMTALGGLIQPTWSDEVEGVELNNILSDLRLRHRFKYPKSVMDALKLTAPALGPPKPSVAKDPLGVFK